MERVGVRGPFQKLRLVERPPHPPPLYLPPAQGRERGGDLSPQAGRGDGCLSATVPSPNDVHRGVLTCASCGGARASAPNRLPLSGSRLCCRPTCRHLPPRPPPGLATP